ncbi:hypothetical protein PQD71_gp088 [Kosakonia phage Kc263]|uniref:Uncharacterized protein n=1 Tax=Kosakonia phage Kc263 TaxID=2863194 RepID=A0AAE7WGQ1_9CAUD|nr:hypothetical protein PQD71_gp088 [Kosakonia phage Kc263]QYN79981.1 hypothetical protein [Kosakonia phage Kc263]
MSIDIVNVSETRLKKLAISLFNQVNKTDVDVPLTDLSFERTTIDGKVLLQNPSTKTGVIMNKIRIEDLFPKTLDLRPFMTTFVKNAPVLASTDVDALNQRHATVIALQEANLLNSATMFDEALVKKFILFCRVFGFYELGIGDVTLNEYDGKMGIAVVSTHALFTGYLEVLV